MTHQSYSTNPCAQLAAELEHASRVADLTGDEFEFERVSDRRWQAEDDVLANGTLADKVRVLARRAADELDVTDDLIRVAASLDDEVRYS